MALKVEVDTLDGIDATLHGLYKKGDDERFRLDIEGLPDVSGLKNALNDERNQRKMLADKVKQFDGVDIDFYSKISSKRDLFEKFEKTGGVDEEAINAQVETRVSRLKDETKKTVDSLTGKLSATEQRLSKLLIDNTVGDAALKTGVLPTAMEDVLRRAKETFRVVEGLVVPQDASGNTLYGMDGVKPLTQEEWLSDLRTSAPHLFKASKGGGAGPSGGEGGGGGTTVRFKDDLRNSAEKAKFITDHGMDAYLELPNKKTGT